MTVLSLERDRGKVVLGEKTEKDRYEEGNDYDSTKSGAR